MKLDYFKDCVIGTELKLDLFLDRNRWLMSDIAVSATKEWIRQKAVVLRFSIEPNWSEKVLVLEMLIDGEYQKREIGLKIPEQHESTGIIY